MQSTRFTNKIAVVTGGNSGIGLATAQALVAGGAKVVIAGRDQTTLDSARAQLGSSATAIRADVGSLADIEALASEVGRQFGRVDILFVNAGIAHFRPIEQVDELFFDQHLDINFKGAYFTIQKFLPLFTQGGAIVVNGTAAVNVGMPNASVYTATKAALNSLVRTLSSELVARKIRLNAVNPGPIETPIFERMGMPKEQLDETAKWILSQVPQGRFGKAEEIAQAVCYLASDQASYVTGVELTVDGGMTTL